MFGRKKQAESTENLTIEEQIALEESKSGSGGLIIKIVLGVVLVVVFIVVIAFTNNKTRQGLLEAQRTREESIFAAHEDELQKLRDELEEKSKSTVLQVNPETSLQQLTADGIPRLFLRGDQFINPNPLNVPDSGVDSNDSIIFVGQRFRFRPSGNWLNIIKGNEVEIIHPEQKIWGKFKAFVVKENIKDIQTRNDIITDYFQGVPVIGTITSKNISIDGRITGILASAKTEIYKSPEEGEEVVDVDSLPKKTMIMTVGFVQRGENMLEFLFLNNESTEYTADEMIKTLLASVNINDNYIKLE